MSDLWADLDAASKVDGPTMTITKAQYAALLEVARTPDAAMLAEALYVDRWGEWPPRDGPDDPHLTVARERAIRILKYAAARFRETHGA